MCVTGPHGENTTSFNLHLILMDIDEGCVSVAEDQIRLFVNYLLFLCRKMCIFDRVFLLDYNSALSRINLCSLIVTLLKRSSWNDLSI